MMHDPNSNDSQSAKQAPTDMPHVDASGFNQVDAEFVRVLEDLIDTLIAKNVIRLTDLPSAAQKKLIERKGLRNRLQDALNPLSPYDELC